MVSLKNNEIEKEIIKEFAVWFQTPFGLFQELKYAKEKVDGDPDSLIVPMPIALGAGGIYEVITRY